MNDMEGAPTEEELEDINSEWFNTRLNDLKYETGYMDDVAGRNIEFPRMYREDGMVYVYVDGQFIYNHGIVFEINSDGSYTRKGCYKNKNQFVGSNVDEKMLPDPIDVNWLMKLYFEKALNLECAFRSDTNIVLCKQWLEKNEFDLTPDLYKLLSAIRDSEVDFYNRHEGNLKINILHKQIQNAAGAPCHLKRFGRIGATTCKWYWSNASPTHQRSNLDGAGLPLF